MPEVRNLVQAAVLVRVAVMVVTVDQAHQVKETRGAGLIKMPITQVAEAAVPVLRVLRVREA